LIAVREYGLNVNCNELFSEEDNIIFNIIYYIYYILYILILYIIENRSVHSLELNFSTPINTKQIQSFFGLIGYFWKFIPAHSDIACSLSNFLKKDMRFQFKDKY
jgi:cellulose synthase/poly-beta-1,6-N-acetylglucosamine synthase-like glycosyltransferase